MLLLPYSRGTFASSLSSKNYNPSDSFNNRLRGLFRKVAHARRLTAQKKRGKAAARVIRAAAAARVEAFPSLRINFAKALIERLCAPRSQPIG